jgi:DNA repair exonuclease SbcCD ATPase subunit
MPLQIFKKQSKTPPVERVKELSSHGFSEPEIIDVLRREGYSPQEIDIALTQVLKEKLMSTSQEAKDEKTEKIPSFEEVVKKVQPEQPEQTTQTFQTQSQYPQYSWEDYFNYIDYLIHSRVSEIAKEVEKINLKSQNLENRIEEIIRDFKEATKSREDYYDKILKKIEELNSSINELSKRINALEEIFKEILPALIDSVRSLSRLVKEK